MSRVLLEGSFDDMKLRDFRLLEEASKLGELHVVLRPDDSTTKFPIDEREYLVGAVRFVHRVHRSMPTFEARRVSPADFDPRDPIPPADDSMPQRSGTRVVVTGCYDWFHSGHVRFFEEASQLGELFVIVGHDANVRQLKGERHPMFAAKHRRYIVSTIRHVARTIVSTGEGWMDAEPEIARSKPHIYAVNEDGDRREKREFCERHGIEYRVLTRLPRAGLPRRESRGLRGY